MPVREMLLHLACVLSGLGVCLSGALLTSTGHAAHAVGGVTLVPLGAVGVGLEGWHPVKPAAGRRRDEMKTPPGPSGDGYGRRGLGADYLITHLMACFPLVPSHFDGLQLVARCPVG